MYRSRASILMRTSRSSTGFASPTNARSPTTKRMPVCKAFMASSLRSAGTQERFLLWTWMTAARFASSSKESPFRWSRISPFLTCGPSKKHGAELVTQPAHAAAR